MPPLSEATFFILIALAPGALHGYAIMKEVAALSDGRIKLSTGTLYTALHRLLEDGWIETVEADEFPRGRRTYRLTSTGRAAVHSETERLSTLALIAQRRLGESR